MHAKTLQGTKKSARPRWAAVLAGMALGMVAVILVAAPVLAKPEQQAKTSHAVAGRENCLTCHPVGGGVLPAPASHASYTNATCLSCHPAGQAAAPAPAKPASEPPPAPTAVPAAPATQPAPTGDAAAPTAAPTVQPAAAPTPQAVPAGQSPAIAPAAPPAAPSSSCMDCHKNPGLAMTLPNGDKVSLFVDESAMAKSIHQGKLGCTDCHSNITGFPHPKLSMNSAREFSVAQYEACKRCHFQNYTKTLDSIHYQVMQAGNMNAPLCTDCHGYHNVTTPDEPRTKISAACARCHESVYNTYAQSVHGSALVKDDNKDVPVCTDCHGSHTIQQADTAAFKLDSPDMCAGCHSNAPLMSKYGLSSNVFKTYVQDFHGTTVALAQKQGPGSWNGTAVCSDCHGVHDIKSFKNADPATIKKSMVVACQKCHPDAGANFPDAWMGHYDISLDKTPLPWLVRAWYVVLIPFMLGGLMLHIVVDLWRIARNR